QTFPARMARRVLRAALTTGLLFGTEKVSISISDDNLFVRFLSEVANGSTQTRARSETGAPLPAFGILAGNPNAVGQRFVFLLFDTNGKPAMVVKVGITDEAKGLIRREKDFLQQAPNVRGIPRLRDAFESPQAEAFALDFVKG